MNQFQVDLTVRALSFSSVNSIVCSTEQIILITVTWMNYRYLKIVQGLFQVSHNTCRRHKEAQWNCEGIQCFWMRDDSSDITKGMCAVDGRHRAMQGEARAIGCIFVCCLHLLGAISRQQPTTIRCLRGRECETESVKEECKWGERVNGKDCNCKRKWGTIWKYEKRTQAGLSLIF